MFHRRLTVLKSYSFKTLKLYFCILSIVAQNCINFQIIHHAQLITYSLSLSLSLSFSYIHK